MHNQTLGKMVNEWNNIFFFNFHVNLHQGFGVEHLHLWFISGVGTDFSQVLLGNDFAAAGYEWPCSRINMRRHLKPLEILISGSMLHQNLYLPSKPLCDLYMSTFKYSVRPKAAL